MFGSDPHFLLLICMKNCHTFRVRLACTVALSQIQWLELLTLILLIFSLYTSSIFYSSLGMNCNVHLNLLQIVSLCIYRIVHHECYLNTPLFLNLSVDILYCKCFSALYVCLSLCFTHQCLVILVCYMSKFCAYNSRVFRVENLTRTKYTFILFEKHILQNLMKESGWIDRVQECISHMVAIWVMVW